MRHRKQKKTLDRKAAARTALIQILATQLILYEKIRTTEAKAKVIRPFIERLITKGRVNTLASRRYLMKYLSLDNAVKKLLEEISPRYLERNGGYTRITKLPQRQGDAARMARIEFV